MKVVPHSKTAEGRIQGLENSKVWKNALDKNQPYLYVVWKRKPKDYYNIEVMLSDKEKDPIGDYFICYDFEPYNIITNNQQN